MKIGYTVAMNYFYRAESGNPYRNLAVEAVLPAGREHDFGLYLWQNDPVVVIGRNQDARKECNLALAREQNVFVARRTTGGGAVYHDRGNLNFSFFSPVDRYCLNDNLTIVENALARFGIAAERSGRNDLTVNGAKFSGNAFLTRGGYRLHHGTLLIDADLAAASALLTPSLSKLKSKGVDSVRSRIVNLSSIAPDLSVERAISALSDAFRAFYGTVEAVTPKESRVKAVSEELAASDWIFGKSPPAEIDETFVCPTGEFRICVATRGNRIDDVKIFTDALDPTIAPAIEKTVRNAGLSETDLQSRLSLHGIAGEETYRVLSRYFGF